MRTRIDAGRSTGRRSLNCWSAPRAAATQSVRTGWRGAIGSRRDWSGQNVPDRPIVYIYSWVLWSVSLSDDGFHGLQIVPSPVRIRSCIVCVSSGVMSLPDRARWPTDRRSPCVHIRVPAPPLTKTKTKTTFGITESVSPPQRARCSFRDASGIGAVLLRGVTFGTTRSGRSPVERPSTDPVGLTWRRLHFFRFRRSAESTAWYRLLGADIDGVYFATTVWQRPQLYGVSWRA